MASAVFDGAGNTTFLIAKDAAGQLYTFVGNTNWTIEEGKEYSTIFVVDGEEFSGSTSEGRRGGLFDTFDPEFEAWFRTGRGLTIRMNGQDIARLSLSGSSAAMDRVNACQRALFATLTREERDAIRFGDIPINPFASSGSVPAAAPHGPRPIDPGRWAARIQENYPAIAIRNGWSGAVGLRVDVSAEGGVAACQVTESSGHPELDQAACENMTRYARFDPAVDERGMAIAGSYATRAVYQLSQ